MTPKLRVENLDKRFFDHGRRVTALLDVNLDIQSGECVTIVGASGCGKSTLLRMLAGLEEVTSGKIFVDGYPVTGPGVDRAMVFQHYSLYPWLTVLDNIQFSHRFKANRELFSKEEARARANTLLKTVGLERFANSYPTQLSGGMQQRVAIARAMMPVPKVLLMDEPFGALDVQTREVMNDVVQHVFEAEKTTIVFVTHDVDEAIYLGQRMVLMAPNPGHIVKTVVVPLPDKRYTALRRTPEFLQIKAQVLDHLRDTSGMTTNMDLMQQLNTAAPQ